MITTREDPVVITQKNTISQNILTKGQQSTCQKREQDKKQRKMDT